MPLPVNKPHHMNKPLDFIDLRHTNIDHVSSLSINGTLGKGSMTVVGNLEHNAKIVPRSRADADKWIAWLQEWKEANPE